jgi:hypothetical protein
MVGPEEAVRAYHGVLQGKGIKPHRPLDEDLKLTDQAMSYDGHDPASGVRRLAVEAEVRLTGTWSPERITGQVAN